MLTDQELLKMRENKGEYPKRAYLQIARNRYKEGLNLKNENPGLEVVTIDERGVWSAKGCGNEGKYSIQAFEKIGYHTGTNAFLQGLKDANVKIIDNREEDDF